MRLEPLIKHFGSQAALADILGVTQVAVHFWVKEDALPPRRAIQIEDITNGVFKASGLVDSEVRHDNR